MTPALQSLLFEIRQHAGFQDLLKAVTPPTPPRYSPHRAETLETMGAKTVFASGEQAQHERWITILTGTVPARETETSQQEKS
jgi:hypothetical protein